MLHNPRGIVGPALDAGRDLVTLRVGNGLWVDGGTFPGLLTPTGDQPDTGRLDAALQFYGGELLAGFGPADAPACGASPPRAPSGVSGPSRRR